MDNNIQLTYPFTRTSSQKHINTTIYMLFFLGVLFSIAANTTLNIILAGVVLSYIGISFFPQSFTTAIFFSLLYQWFQVVIKVIYSTIDDTPLISMTDYPENIQRAFVLSIITILFLSLGIQSQLKKICYSKQEFYNQLDKYSTSKIFIIYVVFTISTPLIYLFGNIIPGIYQAITLLFYFKWSIFIILFLSVSRKKEMVTPFILLIVFEFISSLFSYFAGFKSIMFYLLIGFSSVNYITKTKLILGICFGGIIYIFAIFWTDIKGDYRLFLNQGTKSQSVLVSQTEANAYLINQILNYNFSNYSKAKENFIDRISYIDFFSATISYVPARLPHEDGEILKNSISHILMPRFLFPNKERIDDSDHLNKYTGLAFSNYEQGVSFSLGYAGDFYIDFGEVLMFPFIFLFGVLIGYILLSIYRTSINIVWGIGALTSSFELLYKFENSQIKFLGNLIWFWIVFYLINRYILPKLHIYLLEKVK